MKKRIVCALIAVFFGIALFVGCENSKANQVKAAQQVKTTYTCPMHPEIQAESKGRCPRCGMDLVVKGQ